MGFDHTTARSHMHKHHHLIEAVTSNYSIVSVHSHQHPHLPRHWAEHMAPKDFGEVGPEDAHPHAKSDPGGRILKLDSDGKVHAGPVGKVAEADELRRQAAEPGTSDMLYKAYTKRANQLDPAGDPAISGRSADYWRDQANRTDDPALQRGYRQLAAERQRRR
jgi:hypothetical protein